jgi:hypothetical protein
VPGTVSDYLLSLVYGPNYKQRDLFVWRNSMQAQNGVSYPYLSLGNSSKELPTKYVATYLMGKLMESLGPALSRPFQKDSDSYFLDRSTLCLPQLFDELMDQVSPLDLSAITDPATPLQSLQSHYEAWLAEVQRKIDCNLKAMLQPLPSYDLEILAADPNPGLITKIFLALAKEIACSWEQGPKVVTTILDDYLDKILDGLYLSASSRKKAAIAQREFRMLDIEDGNISAMCWILSPLTRRMNWICLQLIGSPACWTV